LRICEIGGRSLLFWRAETGEAAAEEDEDEEVEEDALLLLSTEERQLGSRPEAD
jgi:hypothetical protein